MEWGVSRELNETNGTLVLDDASELLEDDDILDDELLNAVTPEVSDLDRLPIAEPRRGFCGRCISSSFLSTSLLSRTGLYAAECNGLSQSCRFDASVQQYYSAPDDDIPLLYVSLVLPFQLIELIALQSSVSPLS